MSQVVVYSSDWCPYCMRAKALLEKKGVAFEEIKVDGKPARPFRRSGSAPGTSVDAMTCSPWSAPVNSMRCCTSDSQPLKDPKIKKDLR